VRSLRLEGRLKAVKGWCLRRAPFLLVAQPGQVAPERPGELTKPLSLGRDAKIWRGKRVQQRFLDIAEGRLDVQRLVVDQAVRRGEL